ncbi:MAG: GTPase Era, partial [Cyanobacteria bacterium REEB65]|nr:GTPase Era [Cyanobacteria bacterium REEB65]
MRRRAPRSGGTTAFRSGFVAIVGRPNVGKSTLLNRYVGQKIAIVSNKAQTTRHRIRAIVNRPHSQIVFVDTPGFHKPLHLLGQSLLCEAEAALAEVDLVVVMVDANVPPGPGDRFVAEAAFGSGKPVFLALNKMDRGQVTPQNIEAYRALGPFAEALTMSAQRGSKCEALLRELEAALPIGPRYYPGEEPTDQTER